MPRPGSPTPLLLCFSLLASLACNALVPPKPPLNWDASPSAVIVEVTIIGGLVPREYVMNAIPDARVWGDGRIVWVEYIDAQRGFQGASVNE